jgi:hypothetical protein
LRFRIASIAPIKNHYALGHRRIQNNVAQSNHSRLWVVVLGFVAQILTQAVGFQGNPQPRPALTLVNGHRVVSYENNVSSASVPMSPT